MPKRPAGAGPDPAGARGLAFDAVADLYDRARPSYPEALVDDVLSLSGVPGGGRVLEIGCGTGKATASFAARGVRMLGLEPGASLARVARGRLAAFPDVDVVERTFEAWPLEPAAFDLVISAQAFHWLSPEIRFAKSADALRPGGALAIFGNAPVVERSPVRRDLDRVYAQYARLMALRPSTHWYADRVSVANLFRESGRFGEVTWRRYPWSRDYATDAYDALLRTHSDHATLPDEARESLLASVRETIDRHGGTITVQYEAHLYVARRE